ncbi:MAG: hypothetical protein ACXVZO_09400, partial [Gaiellaceae bacterium]
GTTWSVSGFGVCNHGATERIDTNRHETTRRPVQNELRRHRTARIDTERHESARQAADMESNKDLK